MKHFMYVWWAAIDTEYAREPDWIAWADQQILSIDLPPMWILDLALVHTKHEASEVIGRYYSTMSTRPDSGKWREWYDQIWFGFLFLRFERGDLDLLNLLLSAGYRADACDSGPISCETFFMLANEIDGGGPTGQCIRPLIERAADLFTPGAELARREWTNLWKGLEKPIDDVYDV